MQKVVAPAKSSIVLHVEGSLETESVPRFRALVAGLPRGTNVVLDIRDVPFVDSAGLGALIGAIRRVRENGGEALICRPRPSVRRALHLTAIDRSVSVVSNIVEAEEHLLGRPAAA
jgi:anti-sigma B factor antagonist